MLPLLDKSFMTIIPHPHQNYSPAKACWCTFIASVLVIFRLSSVVAHWWDSTWIRFFFPVACEASCRVGMSRAGNDHHSGDLGDVPPFFMVA